MLIIFILSLLIRVIALLFFGVDNRDTTVIEKQLLDIEKKLIIYAKNYYIDNYKRLDFENDIKNIINTNNRILSRGVLKTSLYELKSFITNSIAWCDTRNILFIKNEKILEKKFFNTIESNPLTEKQTDAVLTNEVHNLILAGAGSGKTSVVVAKVLYMIKKNIINPEEVLILAFNKKAQLELAERFDSKNVNVDIRTFHSFGLNVIGDLI